MANIGTAYIKIAPNLAGVSGQIRKGLTGTGTDFSKQFAKEATKNISSMSMFDGLKSTAKGIGSTLSAEITNPIKNKIGGALAPVAQKVSSAFAPVGQKVGGAFAGVKENIASRFSGISEAIGAKFAPLTSKLGAISSGIGSAFSNGLGSAINSKLGGLSSKMGGLFSGIGKTAVAGIAVGGTALAGLGAKAVSAFADFEQLEGGIQTIFGKSAPQVMANAQQAFKTTGMSANDYMKNVSSFSSSLLQSVGGDTAKAADLANKAMISISDNSAKFGTNIQDVQNAFQGFAKQNYTMLDNLKLGYGGTKSEMERLLKDAQKISGVKYDINSFADITKAIDVVQQKMGIAGTTQKEATATISGSLGMLKSSWTDLLAGLAGGGAPLEQLVNNVVSSFGAVVQNIAPVLSKLLPNIATALSQMITKLIPIITQTLPTLLPALINGAVSLINALVQAFPQIVQALLGAVPTLIQGFMTLFISILDALPQIIDTITSMIPQIVNSLVSVLTNPDSLLKIVNGGIQLMLALIKAIPVIIVELTKALPTIIENIVKTLTSPQYISMVLGAGVELIKGLISGIGSMLGAIGGAVGKIIGTIGKTLAPENLARIGGDLIKGLWNGISNLGGWILDKIGSFAKGIIDGVKGFFGIHSPSRVFADIGKWNMLGLARGIDKNAGVAQKSMTKAMDGLISDASMLDSNFSHAFEANAQYTAQNADISPKAGGVNITVNATVSDNMDINQLGIKLGEMVNNA